MANLFSSVLKKNIVTVSERITNFGKVSGNLFSNGVIETNQLDEMNKEAADYDKCFSLILIVMKKEKADFDLLIKALNDSGNKHVAKLLSDKLIEAENGQVDQDESDTVVQMRQFLPENTELGQDNRTRPCCSRKDAAIITLGILSTISTCIAFGYAVNYYSASKEVTSLKSKAKQLTWECESMSQNWSTQFYDVEKQCTATKDELSTLKLDCAQLSSEYNDMSDKYSTLQSQYDEIANSSSSRSLNDTLEPEPDNLFPLAIDFPMYNIGSKLTTPTVRFKLTITSGEGDNSGTSCNWLRWYPNPAGAAKVIELRLKGDFGQQEINHFRRIFRKIRRLYENGVQIEIKPPP